MGRLAVAFVMLAFVVGCSEQRDTFTSSQNGLVVNVSVAKRHRQQYVTVDVKDAATNAPVRTAEVGVETSTMESQAANLNNGSYTAKFPPDDGINVVVSDSGRTAVLQIVAR